MKYCALAVAIALVGVAPLFAQTSSAANLPPGWVDGSKTPNLIPDRAAYRLVFMRLMLPVSPDATVIARQEARLARIGLSATDAATLKQALAAFAGSYSSWAQTVGVPSTEDQAWAIVRATQNTLQTQLSSDGNSKFSAYVALEKRHMIVKP
jgi:hypothetical protein